MDMNLSLQGQPDVQCSLCLVTGKQSRPAEPLARGRPAPIRKRIDGTSHHPSLTCLLRQRLYEERIMLQPMTINWYNT